MAANPRTTKAASATVGIQFDDLNDWGNGFVGAVTLANTSGRAFTTWTLEFDLAQDITNLWNGVITSHTGTHYTVRNADWNGNVPANGAVSFGFQATGGNPVLPTAFTFNGIPVGSTQVGGTAPPSPPPIISIAPATITETTAPTAALTFQLTLSTPSTRPITVAWSTADGTALAGRDYDAASGTVTFAPGATTATIAIATHPGAQPTEAFTIKLASPSGATLATPQATGTILNPPKPTISVSDITVHQAAVTGTTPAPGPATLLPSGYLHTQGNQIVTAQGTAVKIAAVNWFGMETSNFAPHGLWTASYKSSMAQMVQLGFNAIRLPFSDQLFAPGSTPNGIDFAKNPDLQGLTGLQIMDKIVDQATQLGLKIILDHHRSSAGNGPNDNGLWADSTYPEKAWIDDWTMLARHYAGNTTVIGADLANEPHGPATWGDGTANDWAAAATRAGNAIQAVNPNWLILVEGIESYQGQSTWWGGNLQGVAAHPVTLGTPNQVAYSPHDYPASVYPQAWFNDPNYPNNLPAVWDKEWGYIAKSGTAPILVGEFGTKLATTGDRQWLQAFIDYIDGTGPGSIPVAANQQGTSWAYWSWNPNSGDTGGILKDDWSSVNTDKVAAIQPAEYHGTPSTTSGNTPTPDGTATFTVALSAAATQQVTVHYATIDGTAHAGSDYAPITGDLVFAPGEISHTVSTQLYATQGQTGAMSFLLALTTPQNATLATPQATATLIHDPATTTPTPIPTPPSTATLLLETVNTWQGGYQESITIKPGASPLTTWRVQIDTADNINNLWNGIILAHTGTTYIVGNAPYNGAIAANGAAAFGFTTDHATGAGLAAHLL